MQKKTKRVAAFGFLVPLILACAVWQSSAFARETHPSMVPISQYLMPEKAEIALARSAAPHSISDGATVMVLGQEGYTTAAKGKNGFLCLVARSWDFPTKVHEFWDTKLRGPVCLNPAAARTIAPIYLMKTRLVLEGKSMKEVDQALTSAFNKKEFPTLAPGAMSYMMSKQQLIGRGDVRWYPHVMVYVPGNGNAGKTWGAGLAGSPITAGYQADYRCTVMNVVVRHWSDGTPAPQAMR